MIGVMTGVFNWMLARAGYLAPFTAGSLAEITDKLAANSWNAQVGLEALKPAADGVYTVALAQPHSVSWAITFAFVGLELFTSIIAFVLLFFLKVEKDLPQEQAEIRARREKTEE